MARSGNTTPKARPGPWVLVCDVPEFAVEAAQVAATLGLELCPEISSTPYARAVELRNAGEAVVVAALESPRPDELVALSESGTEAVGIPLCLLGDREVLRNIALDLGIVACPELRPTLSVAALLDALGPDAMVSGSKGKANKASLGDLPAHDRIRLEKACSGGKAGLRMIPADHGQVALRTPAGEHRIGEARDAALAIDLLQQAQRWSRPAMPTVEGVHPQAVLNVLLGPARALSDPASKAALHEYDVPLPEEELCSSASRAAAEATRLGFPVRLVLASPDLRIADNPDLVVESVDSAARVRDAFRQMTRMAKARAAKARILGVTVSAATPPQARLRVVLRPLDDALVLALISDMDGGDTEPLPMVLPRGEAAFDAALRRFPNQKKLFPGNANDRRFVVEAIGDTLLRVAALIHEHREELVEVRLQPLAVLVSGEVEVRDACIVVGDAFEKSLRGL